MRPATLLGAGKVDELGGAIAADAIDLVIVDHPLTPVQQRNLEKAWNTKVLDRTGLILEISASGRRRGKGGCRSNSRISTTSGAGWCGRGPTSNGSAAVSASSAGRARRRSRPTGGLIQERITRIEAGTRTGRERDAPPAAQRTAQAVPQPIVALVGYTNAGKTTLFNA